MNKGIVNTAFVLLIMCAGHNYSEEVEVRDAMVLVLIQSGNPGEDQYRNIIEDTVKIELESEKLQVLTGNGTEDISNLNTAEELAKSKNADFIIAGVYTINNRLLEIEFLWYDAQLKQISEPVFERVVMDLAFDEKISEKVKEIIYLMQERIKEFPLVTIDNFQIEQTEIIENKEEDNANIVLINKEELDSIRLFDTVTDNKENYIETQTGFAPFVCIGRASDYFKIGFIPTVNVNYVFNLSFGEIGFGISTGINLFNIEVLGSGSSFFLPFGANVMYQTEFPKKFNFSVRISAGPSVFSVKNGSERLSKIMIFLFGGTGLEIGITEKLGIFIEAGYYIFFEEEDPVMGFAPCVYFYFRI